MLLTPQQVVDLCKKPAYASDLDAGRALERRHRLHIDGDLGLLRQFLTERNPGLLASPEALETMLTVMKPATKTLFSGMVSVLDKIFTAAGSTNYFEFSDPALAEDFQDYLADTTRAGEDFYGQFRTVWSKNRLTGFQGVLRVDIRPPAPEDIAGVANVPTGLPEPFFAYVPSSTIWDMQLTGNRIEYLILTATDANKRTEYYCWDDLYCHRVQNLNGELQYVQQLRVVHGLPYVPACPVTRKQPDPSRPVRRASPIEKALEVADTYLADYNKHELGKEYHAHPQKWSYGVKCDYVPYLDAEDRDAGHFASQCNAGKVSTTGKGEFQCPRCNGQGRYIPTGPEKVYIVEVPTDKEAPNIIPPLGYVVPDLKSLEYLGNELKVNEAKIERAVLGKSGILEMQTKAESGLKAMADLGPLTDRLNDGGADAATAQRFLADAMARIRYGAENYRASAMSMGRRYHFFDEQVVMAEYREAKEAGADASLLYSLLEDAIYAKFDSDPMERERNLLKLELTPAPHLTVKEAQELGFIGEDDLLKKAFISDFIADFERKNGSILEFGSAVSHEKKIKSINQEFNAFIDGKRTEKPAPLQPGTLVANPATGGDPGNANPVRPAGSPAAQPTGSGIGG